MSKASKALSPKIIRDPTDREKAAMDLAKERYNARKAPLKYKVSREFEGAIKLDDPHSSNEGHTLHGLDAFGTASIAFKNHAISQIGSVLRQQGKDDLEEIELNAGLAAISGIAPENEVEAMLAVQMVATHDLAMKTMRQMNYTTDPDRMDKFCTIATKMLRTYTTQVEALAKLRRGGAQTVRVEHVHVYQGGQAIVGNVQGAGVPRGMIENGNQPHALSGPAAHALQAGPEMLCANPQGPGMPVAGSVGEAPVPNARRRERKRGTVR